MKTTVIFYKEREGDFSTILAVFPWMHEKIGEVHCYSHIEQHSRAGTEYLESLDRATKKEYADLKSELERIGYELKVL